MASPKFSKNNPTNRNQVRTKYALSNDCEECLGCAKGIAYVERFKIKKQGNGVICKK